MKLVDMLGLKPRPAKGPGSTPGTGILITFFYFASNVNLIANVKPFLTHNVFLWKTTVGWTFNNVVFFHFVFSYLLVFVLINFLAIKFFKKLLMSFNLPSLENSAKKRFHTITYFLWVLFSSILLIPFFQILFLWAHASNLYFISYSSLWAISYFAYLIYVFFVISIALYTLSNLHTYTLSNQIPFFSLNGLDLIRTGLSFIFFALLLHATWTGPTLTAWFGHIEFASFQFKFICILYFFFVTYLTVFLATHHLSSINGFDYLITIYNFFLWILLITFANNLFTFIFFLELISATITLLLVSSSFSSTYFYSNSSFEMHSYFTTSTPTAFLQTLMFFFWITLIASLILFLAILTFYIRYFSFDFNLLTTVFTFLLLNSSSTSLIVLSLPWTLFLIAISIKCGLLPFYLWKPSFFKGMTMSSLFFYIYIYYFTIFFLFIYLLCFYFHELFIFFISFTLIILLISTLGLTSLIFESFYVKSFLALSSILNSTLVLYGLCGFQMFDSFFFI